MFAARRFVELKILKSFLAMLLFTAALGDTMPRNDGSNRHTKKRRAEQPANLARYKTDRKRTVDTQTLAERQIAQPGYDEDFQ